jgi:hypothetical protein
MRNTWRRQRAYGKELWKAHKELHLNLETTKGNKTYPVKILFFSMETTTTIVTRTQVTLLVKERGERDG